MGIKTAKATWSGSSTFQTNSGQSLFISGQTKIGLEPSVKKGGIGSFSGRSTLVGGFPINAYHRLLGWWRTRSIDRNEEEILSSLPDHTGQSNLLQEDLYQKRPVYRIDPTNHLPYIDFDKTRGDFLSSNATKEVQNTPLTAFIVFRPRQIPERHEAGVSQLLSFSSEPKQSKPTHQWRIGFSIDESNGTFHILTKGQTGARHYSTPLTTEDGNLPWMSLSVVMTSKSEQGRAFRGKEELSPDRTVTGSLTPKKDGKVCVGLDKNQNGFLEADIADVALFQGERRTREIEKMQTFLMGDYHRPFFEEHVSEANLSTSPSKDRERGAAGTFEGTSTVDQPVGYVRPSDFSPSITLSSHDLPEGDLRSWGHMGTRTDEPATVKNDLNNHPVVHFQPDESMVSNTSVDLTGGPLSFYLLAKISNVSGERTLFSVGDRTPSEEGGRSFVVKTSYNKDKDKDDLIVQLNPDFFETDTIKSKEVIPRDTFFLLTLFLEDKQDSGSRVDSVSVWLDTEMNTESRGTQDSLTIDEGLDRYWEGSPSKRSYAWIGASGATQSYAQVHLITDNPETRRRDIILNWINRQYS